MTFAFSPLSRSDPTTPIAVAIVNHNTREHLRACLESVASIRSEAPSEVVVVDNASSDGSAEMAAAEFPSVVLYRNETNPGYGAAANQAIAACTAQYVLLLNSDTILQPGAPQALTTYLDAHPRAAIVGPRLLNPDGTLQTSCFPFPTLLDLVLDVGHLYPLLRHIPILRDSLLRTWSHTHARPVPWVLGAALAIRREAFEAAGGFDESFFIYFEEVDLCYRLAEAGWQIHFAPVTDVVHVGGASTRHASYIVQHYASLVQFYHRHYSRIRLAGLIMLVEGIALARLMRDSVLIRLTRDPAKRARFAGNLTAWRRLLAGEWRRQAFRSEPLLTDSVMAG